MADKGGGSVVDCAICYNRQVSLTFTKCRQHHYIKTLEENVLLFAELGFPQWEFQQDNDLIHTSNIPKSWFNSQNI